MTEKDKARHCEGGTTEAIPKRHAAVVIARSETTEAIPTMKDYFPLVPRSRNDEKGKRHCEERSDEAVPNDTQLSSLRKTAGFEAIPKGKRAEGRRLLRN